MQKLIEKLEKAGLLNEAQKKALEFKRREVELRKELRKFDLLGRGYAPKVIKDFNPDRDIPIGEDAQHSWASLDGSTVNGKFAILRDGKLSVVEFKNHDGWYSDNGTITSEWSSRWDDHLQVGDIIVAVWWVHEGRSFGSPFEEEEYYLLQTPYPYGKEVVEPLQEALQKIKEELFK